MYRLVVFLITSFILASCSSTPEKSVDDHGHDHGDIGSSVTMWTEKLELFMEHPALIAGQETQFIVHLTKIENYKPVLQGALKLSLHPHGGDGVVIESSAPVRDGIFLPSAVLPAANEYDFTLTYSGKGITEAFDLGHVIIYADEAAADAAMHAHNDAHDSVDGHDHDADNDHDHPHEENTASQLPDELITFLKEQQWKTSFATAFGRRMDVKSSINAVAKIIPNQHGYAEVVAPVEGFINVLHNKSLAAPGSKIKAGDVLATVCPHVGRENTWTERRLSFQRAKKNYERAAGLVERKAISEKEFEAIEQNYLVEKAGYETLQNVYGADGANAAEGCGHFQLKSPIDGIVSKVSVLPGQSIAPGEKIITVVDPSIVWLQADIFEKDYYQLGDALGAKLIVPGMKTPMFLHKNEFVLLNKSDLVNKDSRTISALYEIKNKNRLLKIGQVVQAEIYTSEQQNALCVPETALLDEDERDILFIQHAGEAFEKRVVELGPSYFGWIAVKSGLEEGERIVTQGAYQVKLASMSTGVGQAHVH